MTSPQDPQTDTSNPLPGDPSARGNPLDLLLGSGGYEPENERRAHIVELSDLIDASKDEAETPESLFTRMLALNRLGQLQIQQSDLDSAEQSFLAALDIVPRLAPEEDTFEWFRGTLCFGVAEVLALRGMAAEALAILRDLVLPVFERSQEPAAVAKTKGRMGEALLALGELQEALRIQQEEVLPAYQELEDWPRVAMTLSRIAEILVETGAEAHLAEAVELLQEDVLPFYKEVGDFRASAMTAVQLARELRDQNLVAEPLMLVSQQALPVFLELGDARSLAIAHELICDILVRHEDDQFALEMLEGFAFPQLESLGAVREKATLQLQAAQILDKLDRSEDARRLLIEEALPAFQQCGMPVHAVHAWMRLARIALKAGDRPGVCGALNSAMDLAAPMGDTDLHVAILGIGMEATKEWGEDGLMFELAGKLTAEAVVAQGGGPEGEALGRRADAQLDEPVLTHPGPLGEETGELPRFAPLRLQLDRLPGGHAAHLVR